MMELGNTVITLDGMHNFRVYNNGLEIKNILDFKLMFNADEVPTMEIKVVPYGKFLEVIDCD